MNRKLIERILKGSSRRSRWLNKRLTFLKCNKNSIATKKNYLTTSTTNKNKSKTNQNLLPKHHHLNLTTTKKSNNKSLKFSRHKSTTKPFLNPNLNLNNNHNRNRRTLKAQRKTNLLKNRNQN